MPRRWKHTSETEVLMSNDSCWFVLKQTYVYWRANAYRFTLFHCIIHHPTKHPQLNTARNSSDQFRSTHSSSPITTTTYPVSHPNTIHTSNCTYSPNTGVSSMALAVSSSFIVPLKMNKFSTWLLLVVEIAVDLFILLQVGKVYQSLFVMNGASRCHRHGLFTNREFESVSYHFFPLRDQFERSVRCKGAPHRADEPLLLFEW